MFSDAGPDIRWVGNESGIAGDPCWSTLNPKLLFPGIDEESFKTRLNDDMVGAWGSPQAYINAGDRHRLSPPAPGAEVSNEAGATPNPGKPSMPSHR